MKNFNETHLFLSLIHCNFNSVLQSRFFNNSTLIPSDFFVLLSIRMGSRLNDVRKLQGMLSENNANDQPDLDFLPPRDTLSKNSVSITVAFFQ